MTFSSVAGAFPFSGLSGGHDRGWTKAARADCGAGAGAGGVCRGWTKAAGCPEALGQALSASPSPAGGEEMAARSAAEMGWPCPQPRRWNKRVADTPACLTSRSLPPVSTGVRSATLAGGNRRLGSAFMVGPGVKVSVGGVCCSPVSAPGLWARPPHLGGATRRHFLPRQRGRGCAQGLPQRLRTTGRLRPPSVVSARQPRKRERAQCRSPGKLDQPAPTR